MVLIAILNGLTRDLLLAPALGESVALPLSGVTLSLLILAVVWFTLPLFGALGSGACLGLGLGWVLMTLAFEYLFGHFVAGKSWDAINQVFDLGGGNLFSLVLLVTLVAPWLVTRLRGRSAPP
jgi:hypothetical protein